MKSTKIIGVKMRNKMRPEYIYQLSFNCSKRKRQINWRKSVPEPSNATKEGIKRDQERLVFMFEFKTGGRSCVMLRE